MEHAAQQAHVLVGGINALDDMSPLDAARSLSDMAQHFEATQGVNDTTMTLRLACGGKFEEAGKAAESADPADRNAAREHYKAALEQFSAVRPLLEDIREEHDTQLVQARVFEAIARFSVAKLAQDAVERQTGLAIAQSELSQALELAEHANADIPDEQVLIWKTLGAYIRDYLGDYAGAIDELDEVVQRYHGLADFAAGAHQVELDRLAGLREEYVKAQVCAPAAV